MDSKTFHLMIHKPCSIKHSYTLHFCTEKWNYIDIVVLKDRKKSALYFTKKYYQLMALK